MIWQKRLPSWRKRPQGPAPAPTGSPMLPLWDSGTMKWIRAALAWSRRLVGHPGAPDLNEPDTHVEVRAIGPSSTLSIKSYPIPGAPSDHPIAWVQSPGYAAIVLLQASQKQIQKAQAKAPDITKKIMAQLDPVFAFVATAGPWRSTSRPTEEEEAAYAFRVLTHKAGEVPTVHQTDMFFRRRKGAKGPYAVEIRVAHTGTVKIRPDVMPQAVLRPDIRVVMDLETGDLAAAGYEATDPSMEHHTQLLGPWRRALRRMDTLSLLKIVHALYRKGPYATFPAAMEQSIGVSVPFPGPGFSGTVPRRHSGQRPR